MNHAPIATLLNQLVDYAGLFPPASLPLDQVVTNYRQYTSKNQHQMLGRLIIPAGKLNELAGQLEQLPIQQPDWKISALVPAVESDSSENFESAITQIQNFNQIQINSPNQRAIVDAIEVKASSTQAIKQIITATPNPIEIFLEIVNDENLDDYLNQIAAAQSNRAFAKIRCGGVTPDLIPAAEDVATFVLACHRRGVGFKATAGLHHPLRDIFALTYQPDAPKATMHGFVNLFVGAVLVHGGAIDQLPQLVSILTSQKPSDFVFSDSELGFQNWRVSTQYVSKARQSFVRSFGSCSFEEPTSEISPFLTTQN